MFVWRQDDPGNRAVWYKNTLITYKYLDPELMVIHSTEGKTSEAIEWIEEMNIKHNVKVLSLGRKGFLRQLKNVPGFTVEECTLITYNKETD